MKNLLDECIVVGGQIEGGNFLAKSRDRNYVPHIRIYRELTDNGTEIVYMKDEDTGYAEGMNSHCIGIVNAALLVGDDENAVKGKIKSHDGEIMKKALSCDNLKECLQILISYKGGVKGHTLVADDDQIYSLEMTSKHTPVIKQLEDLSKTIVRTNHGADLDNAGYTPERKPYDYMSSKIRKATAEVQLASVNSFKDVAPSLTKTLFDPDSNYNMKRRTSNMKTCSQCAMHLVDKNFYFYYWPDQCEFLGIENLTPSSHKNSINIKVFKYKNKLPE
jgi:dipeptidase